MFCLLATLIYLLGELPNFRSKTRIQSIVSDLANQNQSQAAGSILKEMIQKSFEEIKDDLKEMIQDQAKQPFQQNKKPLLNQDLFETKIDQLKKELKQTQLQQFHEIRNQQRQLINQQSRESKVSLMSHSLNWHLRVCIMAICIWVVNFPREEHKIIYIFGQRLTKYSKEKIVFFK